MNRFNLVEELGGEVAFEALITDFYDRIYDDAIIGFFFAPHEKEKLIKSQMAYLSATLGDRSGTYVGPSLSQTHRSLPILVGHFDRRHQILKDVLFEHDVQGDVYDVWIALDLSLRDSIVRMGKERAEHLLSQE